MGQRDVAGLSSTPLAPGRPARPVHLVLLGVVALILVLVVGPPSPAVAQTEPTTETLLPPAPEGGVSIVPTDEGRADPADPAATEPPAAPADRDGGRGGGQATRDPTDVATWGFLLLASLGATAVVVTRLGAMLHVWRSPATVRASGFGPVAGEPGTSFSLLVAAEPGNALLGMTIDSLVTLDHPSFEIVVVAHRDDLATRGAALAAAARYPDQVHLAQVDVDLRHRRAAGLNRALATCRGEVVGVFGPGDEVDPQLLTHVDACLARTGADAVQGGVLLVARRRRWFSPRSIVDRYFWSRSRLHLHAQQHFTPLDESTVFIRADVLRAVGGWHKDCVAEGCDLGVRLSVEGAGLVVAYDPELATWRSAPETLRALLRQEGRRVQGFLQVLRMGDWRRLPGRRPRLRARLVLARPFVEAMTGGVIVGAGLAVAVAGGPAPAVLLVLLPVVPLLLTLGVELTALAEMGRIHRRRVRPRDHLWLVVSFVPYQLLLAVAALAALVREVGAVGRRRLSVPVAAAPPPSRGLEGGRSRPLDLRAEPPVPPAEPEVASRAGRR